MCKVGIGLGRADLTDNTDKGNTWSPALWNVAVLDDTEHIGTNYVLALDPLLPCPMPWHSRPLSLEYGVS